jgi:hypothetical protein
MSIWNKVLIGLIFVASLGFFVLSARALKTHQAWRASAEKLEAAIEEKQKEIELLEYGDPEAGTPSLRELQLGLHTRMLDRGRAWYNVAPQQVSVGQDPNTNEQTLLVRVLPSQPIPHGIAAKSVVFVFDQRAFQQGGRYLGQFVVTGVDENGPVVLQPGRKLTQEEENRLRAANGPWILYEMIPKDEEAVFADVSDDAIQQLFPGATQGEYLQEGERKLRDYEVLFAEHQRRWTILTDRLNAAMLDNQYLQGALTNAEAQEQQNQQQIDDAKQQRAKAFAERDAVASHLAALEERLNAVRGGIAQVTRANQALAGEIAKLQLEAIRRVDQRTREMASAPVP